MKKFKVILLSFILIIFSVSIGLSAFLLLNSKIIINITSDQTTKYKVTFTDNGEIKKTMFVDSGYNLSLKDAPYYFNSSGNPIKWYSNDVGIINDYNNTISNNLDFVANSFADSEIDKNEYSNYNNAIPSVAFNDLGQNLYVYSGSFTMYYDGTTVHNDNYGRLVAGDTTIGLSNNTNNYTFKLNRDIILTGNITVGAYTGYYGSSVSYSQISYQGFIINNYCTLDLNGHDLIVGNYNSGNDFSNYATLDAWGEIKDSLNCGLLVLDKYSKFYSTMVIEDIYHEKRMPYTYYTNDNIFSMYRCPYWTCDTKILSGATIQMKYRIDLGGDNSNDAHGDIAMIGPSNFKSIANLNINNFLLYLDGGYIYREISNNSELIANSVINNDLLNQKIIYKVYDANILFDKFYMNFSYSTISKDLDSSSYAFYISPYFSFYLYNSNLTLNQHIVFMPGSYLFVDSKSSINLSYYEDKNQDGVSFIINISKKYWQPVGGLTFLDTLYDMDDLTVVLKVLGNDNTEGYSCYIFQNDNVRKYFWNILDAAYADIYGKITFEKQSFTQYDSIQMGGIINIYNIADFINDYNNAIANGIKITLYSSTFKTDWCRIFKGDSSVTATNYRNVTGYYNYPLISNGYVLLNPQNQTEISNGNYVYDFVAKIIYNKYNLLETYAWIFDNDSMDNLAFCSSLGSINSLNGSFKRVNAIVNTDNSYKGEINYNGNSYIVWHGAYIQYSSENGGYYVGKFFDNEQYGNYSEGIVFWKKYTYLYCRFTYNSNGKYVLSEAIKIEK